MNDQDPIRLRQDIRREAAIWFIELNEDPADRAVRERFDHWLRRSPEHLHAFLQVSMHWEDARPSRRMSVESADELVALARSESNIVALPERKSADVHASDSAPSVKASSFARWRRGTPLVVAASLIMAIAGSVLFWSSFIRGVYQTQVGEQLSVTLADGSTAELNSKSRIRVRYDRDVRRIVLLEGQALFRVAKDRSAPFVVEVGNTRVRALGTQFDVYRKQTGTVVTVVEGRIAVSTSRTSDAVAGDKTGGAGTPPPSRAEGATATSHSPSVQSGSSRHTDILDAGQQIQLGSDGGVAAPETLSAADLDAATAWIQKRLVFKRAPLSEVVAEFNRYSTTPMVIRDPDIAATQISGAFSSSDARDLLRFLREVGAYDVRETTSEIEISRK
jgi:transmembrane sensor